MQRQVLVVLGLVLRRVVAQHLGQDLLGVLQPFGHFGVVTLEGVAEGEVGPVLVLVEVLDELPVGTKEDLGLVLEDHLDDLVGETEHNGLFGLHPLLHVDLRRGTGRGSRYGWLLQVVLEVGQQGVFLGQGGREVLTRVPLELFLALGVSGHVEERGGGVL